MPIPERSGPADPATIWAAERTLLSWVRTGLAAMAFGFVVARFGIFLREVAHVPTPPVHATVAGLAMVALGVFVNVLATIRYAVEYRALVRGEMPTPGGLLPILVSTGAAVIGAVLVVLLGISLGQ